MNYTHDNKRTDSTKTLTFPVMLDFACEEVAFFNKNNNDYSAKDYFLKLRFDIGAHTIAEILTSLKDEDPFKKIKRDYFVNNFFKLDISNNVGMNDIRVDSNLLYKEDDKSVEKELEYYLKSIHQHFLKLSDRVLKYHYKGIDNGLYFKYNTGNRNFPLVLIEFKKNLLSEFYNYDSFKETFKPVLINKLNELISSEISVFNMLEDKEIYVIEDGFDYEKMIKTSQLPSMHKYKYINMEIVNKKEIMFYFSRYHDSGSSHFSNQKHGFIPHNIIQMRVDEKGAYVYSGGKGLLVFLDKNTCQNFINDKLIELRNSIDRLLNKTFEL